MVKALLLMAAGVKQATALTQTRYHQFCRKAKGASGKVRPVKAVAIQSANAEVCYKALFAPDGNIVVVGNLWGPTVPSELHDAVMLGEGQFRKEQSAPYDARQRLNFADPNIAGFAVRFDPNLSTVKAAVRWQWGCASITFAGTAPDGGIYLSGFASPMLKQWLHQKHLLVRIFPAPEPDGSGDLCLMRLSPDLKRLEWAVVFEQAMKTSESQERRIGGLPCVRFGFGNSKTLYAVAHNRVYSGHCDDPSQWQIVGTTKGGVLLGVDPNDSGLLFGGDENTHTGREPWRRPFLYKLNTEGKVVWQLWRWDARLVGNDRYRLVSDSSVRHVAWLPNGDLLVVGWSDGGNSVFSRQPTNLDEPVDFKAGFIDSLWGARVGNFAWLLRLDKMTLTVKAATVWAAFLPTQNRPNSITVDAVSVLEDGRIACVGRSAMALIETPDAWVPTFPHGIGGAYFALFSPDLRDLLFSTVLPYADRLQVTAQGRQVAIAGAVSGELAYADNYLKKPAAPVGLGEPYQPLEHDGYVLLVDAG